MLHTILIFVPLVTLIAMALLTRRMAESMVTAVILAMILLHKGNVLTGSIESMYATLSNPSFQFVLLILTTFGGMIKLLQESGGLLGFGLLVSRFASGPKKPLILAWFMGLLMFIDDFLSTLTVTFSMKEVTDRNGIPREHLAFQANTVASCLCVLFPFTGWTAFTVGLLTEEGLGFDEYVQAIPFMFYPVLAAAVCLLLACGLFPKVGVLKDSYKRVASGGPVLLEETQEKSIVSFEGKENQQPTSAINALPLLVMVVGVLSFGNDLIHGVILAIISQFILYIGQKLMTVGEFFETFFDGAKSMTTLGIIVFCGFTLSAANRDLGVFDILITGASSAVPASVLPLIAFVLVSFTTFATGGCWVMQIICIPIFIPLAQASGVPVHLIIATIMSGVTLGYCLCFYADAVFMTSAGTGVSNLRIIKATLPYALGAAAIAAAGYLLCGFIMV